MPFIGHDRRGKPEARERFVADPGVRRAEAAYWS
jgi:hypothetical protein